ncbi:dihydrodipicolinate synthase family protein [Clostridium lacusfryxellense]|uniref:dihydrodipicolinate synthase family protein n=1 Tax=Clostridium lacusfryxellense TaxID=205328 RepID=UPI001C0D310B|nr:dihydrodipicolinate synthase family protein [Clostridium lacusfryxellense]MBU3113184.1 dihydrodipicolinate synthase family protein [Clostridium lacusfryxellense]
MTARFLTPVVTLFDEFGKLDIQSNKNVYDHLIKGGIDGIVVMGSTGEFFNMPMSQQKELIDLAVGYINKRTKVYIGTSCMSIEDTIEMANYAHNAGADAVMIISPYYFSLSDESIEYFYNTVAAATEANIYLYNFPDRTGYDLSKEITLRLVRKNKNIVGYKDTVMVMAHTRALISLIKSEFPNFDVLSGFDENLVHNILCGGGGCIGGLSNLAPEIFSGWIKAVNNKDFDKMAEYQKIVDKMMKLYDIGTPFIPIVKKAMMVRGIDVKDYCTKPFLQANEKQTEQIIAVMKEINLL